VSASKTLWQWHQGRQAIEEMKKELEGIAGKEQELLLTVEELEKKREALPAAALPDQEVNRLLLEQEIWMVGKELERFREEVQEKRFSLEQSLQEQQFAVLKWEQELDEKILSAYYHVAEYKQRPIVEVKHKACTGCFMLLTQNKINEWRRGKDLVYCDECGRILV